MFYKKICSPFVFCINVKKCLYSGSTISVEVFIVTVIVTIHIFYPPIWSEKANLLLKITSFSIWNVKPIKTLQSETN